MSFGIHAGWLESTWLSVRQALRRCYVINIGAPAGKRRNHRTGAFVNKLLTLDGLSSSYRRFGIFRLGTNYSLSNVSCGDAEKVLRTEEQSGDKSPQSKKNAKLELRGRTRLELRGRRSLFCRLELSRNKLAASPYSFPKLTSTSCLIRGNRFEFTTQFCASSCLPNRRRPNAP